MADLAVRTVLLSKIQSVLSIARRRYGYMLIHAAGASGQDEPQIGIFHSFALLRARLLRCENVSELNPSSVLRPFLDLVRHEHTSSTLTGAALEAVQHFLQCWDWGVNHMSVPDMLADVVDAVSQCRFQETNAESDQHVLVLVVHVLQAVLLCPAANKLSDHAMWQLVEALYALSRANRNDPHITLSLRATATSVLNRAIEFIFQHDAVYADSPVVSSSSVIDSSFGLPCAVKILGFLCQKLQPRGSSMGSSSGGSSAQLATRREVLLSFTLLERVLVACDAQQFAQTPSLMLFIKDDLCGAILRYGRLGASSDLKIPVLCLAIIRLLWTKLRPLLKMQLEALFNGVFCHTLHWCLAHLDLAHPLFPNNLETSTTQPDANGGATGFAFVDAVREEFSGETVPLNKLFSISFEVLDCLVDLLGESTLLPDLYVNYDCDDNRADLLHTLFELLSSVVTKTHQACQETSDEVHFLWAQSVGELALRGLFNAQYVIYARTQQPATTPSSMQSGDSSTSAQALHHKRQRKKIFQHGIVEFNRKPLAGIKLLQQNSFLPTPLDAKSLAGFLRSLPPGLRKTTVGMYLGAMGKEVKDFEKSDIHEADTAEFHRDVLENFVRSFNFESDSIVAALRMFLASFRLPGEAQQIDRILNTFSMQVYEQCRDRFLMASPDVAYLLSFSLIMLNTDLHNPNIRPEKKMKLEDFIKNNRNYGEEVSKKQDLPDDFLTELYEAIAKEEIKTREDDSKHGEVTTDRWKDLLYQAESDPLGSRLIVHKTHHAVSHRSGAHGVSVSSPRHRNHHGRSRKSSHRRSSSRSHSVGSEGDLALSVNKFADASDGDVLKDSFFGIDGGSGHQYDRDIFGLMQDHLKQAFASVFRQFVDVANGPHGGLMDDTPGSNADGSSNSIPDDIYLPDNGMLQLACNGFVLCAATGASHGFSDSVNELFVEVTQFSGLFASEFYPSAYNARVNGIAMFCHNQSAPVATAAMLKIVGACGASLRKQSWQHFFHALATLREFGALPDRLLHSSSEALLSADESVELLDLLRLNREELERREAMRLKNLERTGSGSSFFSGVAWLMSALDTTSTGSAPSTPSSNGARGSLSVLTKEAYPRTSQELATNARDLFMKPEIKREKPVGPVQFGTSSWIVQSLQPYNVENLLDGLCKLPTHALAEVVKAIGAEVEQALMPSDSSKRRVSTFPGAGSASPSTGREEEQPVRVSAGSRRLSPASCVLLEHFLARVLSTFPRDTISERFDGLQTALEAHYLKLPSLVRPILLKNTVVNGIGYDNAGLTLAKALEGMLLIALKSRNEKSLELLLSVLTALVDMSSTEEDELLRPYLTLIFSGLKSVANSVNLREVRFDRGEWLTVSNLIGMAVEQPNASVHAFAFLEKLVASEVWRAEVETTFSLMELYTKTLLFALHKDADPSHERWPQTRPLEIMSGLFDRLHESDPEVEEEERLRQLGGMVLVCRHALRAGVSNSAGGESVTHHVNDRAISSLEFLRGMIVSVPNRDSLTGGAWLEVLSSGLLALGSEILNRKSRFQEANRRRQGSEDSAGPAGPFQFFERNVPPSLALPALPNARDASAKDKSAAGGRHRRPSIVKDPLALRPHLLVVEMLSHVACEQLDQLLLLPRFAAVWDELLDQLLAFVELTSSGLRTGSSVGGASNHNEEVLAALERRSVMSAHEEIVEHVRSIIRRLTVLQNGHEKRKKNQVAGDVGKDDGGDALAGARFHALMHVLVEKCQSKGVAFYEQLFAAQDDGASSAGDLTPPIAEEEESKEAEVELTKEEGEEEETEKEVKLSPLVLDDEIEAQLVTGDDSEDEAQGHEDERESS